MDGLIVVIVIVYLVVCGVILHFLAVDSFSQKRVCEVKFDVGQCQWQMLPYTVETK